MREKLLKTGMGCFVFASGVGVANTLLLPYARAHFGYPVWGTWAAYAAALLLFCLAGRAVSVLEDEKAARLARDVHRVSVCRAPADGVFAGIYARRG